MATTFKDTEDRTWSLDLTIGDIKRVKTMLDIDLLTISDGSFLIELSRDPWRLVDLLYVIAKPQADKLEVSDEDFGSAMGGAALHDASDAFLEGITNFFLCWQPNVGATLEKLHGKIRELESKATDMTKEKLEDQRIDTALEAGFSKVEAQMEEALENLSMDGDSSQSQQES